ncbi:hypothetical protein BH10CHL1_BH10CHL1_24860 [soil metagenome]
MSHDLMAVLQPVIDQLQIAITNDPALRASLRQLVKSVLAFAEEPDPQEPCAAAAAVGADYAANIGQATPQPAAVSEPGLLVTSPLDSEPSNADANATASDQLGDGAVKALPRIGSFTQPLVRTYQPPVARQSLPVTDADLPLIAARCQLKAEGARWAAARQRLLKEGVDFDTAIEPGDRDIIARAKMLPDCFLWMCHRDKPMPADLAQYDELANCFESAAAIVGLLDQLLKEEAQEDGMFEQALDLAAEAQSALRLAITGMDGSGDSDQLKLFNWLRATGAEQQILIHRFMRKDDPADPKDWAQLQQRIQALEEKFQFGKHRVKRQKGLHSKLRYHIKLIHDNSGHERSHDWQKIVEAVEELVNDGLQPSNREIRDLLLPILDDIPETLELPKNFKLVLREIDRFLSSIPQKPEAIVASEPIEEVRRAAELLRGQTIVLIGGDRRPLAAEALTQAFGLKELIWVEGRDQTYADFEPEVARPEVVIVILAIRWSRHGFGEVKAFCEKYRKPLVRLPGGYSPNQIAFHIVSQVGERLDKAGLVEA